MLLLLLSESPGVLCGFDVARICAGTWNVGGTVPPADLDIDGWLDTLEPADIYVLGYCFFLLSFCSHVFHFNYKW